MSIKKAERQALILDLIRQQVIDSQEGLMRALHAAQIDVTQATVSRDIKELRIVRQADSSGQVRYQVLEQGKVKQNQDQVQVAVQQLVKSVQVVAFMIVIKTTSGNGNRVAALLDEANLPGLVGTLAGHDTIYVTSLNETAATTLAAQLNAWR
ncbi:arginine repressor [Weissella halotolerans]|uniref:Arginine repressor n=1 Tax=Weissella halotolerans DSM 20190 TaxID=1123500 RepID=A0A0R2FY15_9LACO|nr:arginine repressor [Weissella halotolerans]KRN33314.1 ArgR family transcriptional regulator [Weissella halotolerans DSM 20190]